ncbi:protease-4 [Mariprofundus ferrinatatus]|uniref:Protease-4 n=1 Tax=Mariprofundus ferrinatatus TaxID=1921087 RepID=A0A2K8L0Z9_9PROT|nr:signal peptide peptidase SppA [Mariprofundus ferrinatatus]ATX80957.1 protease-4 [Mariprofundus ferrinatatus]
MRKFFSTLMIWMDRLRRVLVNGFFILFLVLFVVAISIEQPEVPESAALVLNPKGAIVEELDLPAPSLFPLNSSLGAPHQTRLHDLIRVIRVARDDERIRLMVLKLDEMGDAPLSTLQEIRGAIEAFKESGKMVIAVGPNYSQSQYYLAATADRIFIDPLGIVAIKGFSIYRNYFKDALNKLNVDVQLFRAGEYKAAAEPLVRNDMSDEDRKANRALLDQLWSEYKDDIAALRNINAERMQQVLDKPSLYLASHNGSLAGLAKAEGLADQLARPGAIDEYIAGAMGVEDGSYPSVDFRGYLAVIGDQQEGTLENRIGIISASGMILDGKQPPGTVGSSSMLAMLDEARRDDAIKAVVLRIDSPGGSAQASEVIHSGIMRLKAAGKPVIVSMGSVAASGGYMIAAPADEIWASPSTVTGSIGAFGVLANVGKGLEKLGIHSDGLGTTSVAGGVRADRPLPDELKKVVQLSIQHVYDRFLNIVSEGRGIDREKVESIAEGRVWTGLDAKRLGLIDGLGGFDDAVAAAARHAGLKDYDVEWVTPAQSFREMLIMKLLGSADVMLSYLQAGDPVVQLFGMRQAPLWLQEVTQLRRLMPLSDARPSLLTVCNLKVTP